MSIYRIPAVEMFQGIIFLLFCQAFCSTLQRQYQLENSHQLKIFQDIWPIFYESSSRLKNSDYQIILYKQEQQNISEVKNSILQDEENFSYESQMDFNIQESFNQENEKCVKRAVRLNERLPSNNQPQLVKVTPSPIIVTVGETFTISCSTNIRDIKSITWLRSPGIEIKSNTNYTIKIWNNSANSEINSQLTIHNVSQDTLDSPHHYMCMANKHGSDSYGSTVFLLVTDTAPGTPRLSFSSDFETIFVEENEAYDITCSGRMKSVEWFFNNDKVSENETHDVYQKKEEPTEDNEKKRKLQFNQFQKKNRGEYTCVGYLSFNGTRITRSFHISTKGNYDELRNPELTEGDRKIENYEYYENYNIIRTVGESLEMVCEGNGETIEWKIPSSNRTIPQINSKVKNYRIASSREKNNKVTLNFKSLKIQDNGTYTCEVTKCNETRNSSFALFIMDPSRFVDTVENQTIKEGSHVILNCRVTGYPKPHVIWWHSEFRNSYFNTQTNLHFAIDDDNLLIQNITYRESGLYRCQAIQFTGYFTQALRTIHVNVLHKPYPTKNGTIYEKLLNKTVRIPCNASMVSNPPPNFTWFRNINGSYQILANSSPDSILKFELVNESQYGDYKCVVANEFGSNEIHISIIPMEFPRPPKVKIDTIYKTSIFFKVIAERNSSFLNYITEYRVKNSTNWTEVHFNLGETWDSKYALWNLVENTVYIMKVKSVNELGMSQPSNEIEFTTALGTKLIASFVVLITTKLYIFLV